MDVNFYSRKIRLYWQSEDIISAFSAVGNGITAPRFFRSGFCAGGKAVI